MTWKLLRVASEVHSNLSIAGCLLALLFLIPLAARLYSMVTLLLLVLVYVTFVVPMATGFYTAGSLFGRIRCVFKQWYIPLDTSKVTKPTYSCFLHRWSTKGTTSFCMKNCEFSVSEMSSIHRTLYNIHTGINMSWFSTLTSPQGTGWL